MTTEAGITDAEMADVVDEAVRTIALIRSRTTATNAYREMDAVATLVRHAQSRLPGLVADARDEANSWKEIAAVLGVSRPRVIASYALHVRNRRQPLALD